MGAKTETQRTFALPPRLRALAESSEKGRAWLERLPSQIEELRRRWSLSRVAGADSALGAASCSFVAFAWRADGSPSVLKLGLPHMEAEHEPDALRFWNGDGSVCLLEVDRASGAMLIERCDPGTPLSSCPEPEQDAVLARVLRRLWRPPPAEAHPFRPLAEMLRYWADCALARSADWPDAGFARAGIELLLELGRPAPSDVLLATDLHAGNVLAARREAWLAIDPKPFIGDAAYDATQHLFNCMPRLCADPSGTVASFCELAGVDRRRVREWLVARLAQAAHTRHKTFGLGAREALALARSLENSGN